MEILVVSAYCFIFLAVFLYGCIIIGRKDSIMFLHFKIMWMIALILSVMLIYQFPIKNIGL